MYEGDSIIVTSYREDSILTYYSMTWDGIIIITTLITTTTDDDDDDDDNDDYP